jgi:VanZ family protein
MRDRRTPATFEARSAGSPGRRWRAAYALVALAAAALVVYGSLVPFDFRAPPGDTVGLALRPPSVASRTDFVSNVLLFLPTGFALMGALCAGRLGLLSIAFGGVAAVLSTIALAWLVEWGQQFVPSRTPSWNDVIAAGLAASGAVVLWIAGGSRFTLWADRVMVHRQPRTGLEAVLLLYVVATALLQWLPLDVTIRPAELAEKYRAGRILLVPFASLPPAGFGLLRVVGAALIQFAPYGLLGLFLWMPASGARPPALAVLFGVSVVVIIEAVQLFVYSRVFDVTDILLGAAGVSAGAWIGSRVWSNRTAAPEARGVSWPLLAVPVWSLVLLVRHWYPFDFSVDPEFVRTRLPVVVNVPFRAYYLANPFDALNDAAIKALLAVPVGVLLWLCWPPQATPRVRSWLRNAVLLSAAALFFMVVEAGQLLLPSRFPDVTDVLLGLGGAAVGLIVMARYAHAPASRV